MKPEPQSPPGPQRQVFDPQNPPARAPGPVGVNDRADPDSPSNLWDDHLTDAVAASELPLGDVVTVNGKNHVIYLKEVRAGGSSSWLADNPGNLDYTDEMVTFGAFKGKKLRWGKHRFAIFPDETTGLAAVRKFLRAHQTIRTISLMQKLFAPKGDLTNDPDAYAKSIVAALNAAGSQVTPNKVTIETLVKDLSDAQIEVYAKAIQKEEGWDRDVKTREMWKLDDPTLPQEVQDRLAEKRL